MPRVMKDNFHTICIYRQSSVKTLYKILSKLRLNRNGMRTVYICQSIMTCKYQLRDSSLVCAGSINNKKSLVFSRELFEMLIPILFREQLISLRWWNKHHLQPSILYRLIIGVIRLRLSREWIENCLYIYIPIQNLNIQFYLDFTIFASFCT